VASSPSLSSRSRSSSPIAVFFPLPPRLTHFVS
jgi:hypothetical protein